MLQIVKHWLRLLNYQNTHVFIGVGRHKNKQIEVICMTYG